MSCVSKLRHSSFALINQDNREQPKLLPNFNIYQSLEYVENVIYSSSSFGWFGEEKHAEVFQIVPDNMSEATMPVYESNRQKLNVASQANGFKKKHYIMISSNQRR